MAMCAVVSHTVTHTHTHSVRHCDASLPRLPHSLPPAPQPLTICPHLLCLPCPPPLPAPNPNTHTTPCHMMPNQVYATPAKAATLALLDLPPAQLALLTDDPAGARLHILPMGLKHSRLRGYLVQPGSPWRRVVGIRPTGGTLPPALLLSSLFLSLPPSCSPPSSSSSHIVPTSQ